MCLIGICGKIGTGKNYITTNVIEPILKEKRYIRMSFSDQIKVNLMTMSNISYDDLYIKKPKDIRKLLQKEGTEIGRDIFDEDIWVDYMNNWITVYKNRGINIFICSDIRYKNEYDYIKKNNGYIIKINASERNKHEMLEESNGNLDILKTIQDHTSERTIDFITKCDLTINNDYDDILNIELIKKKLTCYIANFEKV